MNEVVSLWVAGGGGGIIYCVQHEDSKFVSVLLLMQHYRIADMTSKFIIITYCLLKLFEFVHMKSDPVYKIMLLAESVLVAMLKLVMDDTWVAWVLFGIQNVFAVMLATSQLMIMRSKSHLVYLHFNLKLLNIVLHSFSYFLIVLSLWASSECCIWPNLKVSFLVIVFNFRESPFS